MDLRRVDLNLLVAFDALLQTRHVTRAARLIGIGQPGMSAALSRLRQVFQDDLLVKQGAAMVPTARARALEPEVRRILRDVELLVTESAGFDPALSLRRYRLRMSDLLAFLLLPGLARRLPRRAPGVSLEVVHLAPDATVDGLERNEIELAVSTDLKAPKSIESLPLFEDRAVCLYRTDHPAAGKLKDRAALAALPRIKVSQSPLDDRFEDREAASLAPAALIVPHWLAVPEIVAASDLIAIMPMSIAERFVGGGRLALAPAPSPSIFVWQLYWHRRYRADPGHRWMREMIVEAHNESIPPAGRRGKPSRRGQ